MNDKYIFLNNEVIKLIASFMKSNHKVSKRIFESINKIYKNDNLSYASIILSFLNVDITKPIGRIILEKYFKEMITNVDNFNFKDDLYLKTVKPKKTKSLSWQLKYDTIKPYEIFPCGDYEYKDDGRVIPKLGFLKEKYRYLSLYENNRLWMSITPNEIITMRKSIGKAKGKVLTLGLGLGYFLFHVSIKEDVKEIVVIEKDNNLIKLFNKEILPFFKFNNKISIVNIDCFDYLEKNEISFDYIFCDIWHDVIDGINLYSRLKNIFESKKIKNVSYWIEDTINYYIKK